MIVECPRCNARYRVGDDVVADQPTFKCSRCSHFFGREEKVAVEAMKHGAPVPLEQEPAALVGSQPDAELVATDDHAETILAPPPPPPSEPFRPRRPPVRVGSRADPDTLSLPFSASRALEPAAPRSIPRLTDEPEFALPDDDEDVEDFAIGSAEVSEPRPRFLDEDDRRPFESARDRIRRPYLIFLGVLLLVFGNLALYLRNHPDAAERFLASIPFAGRLLIENRLLQSRVYLRDVEGVYQPIKDGRTVFIVTGRAINTADAPLKGVEIESALYDAAGAPLATKSIFCGNAMSLKIVKDLSSKEISILQRLQPPRRFEIAPGDAAGFSVVFLDPPQGFKEFSARVTAAQPAIS